MKPLIPTLRTLPRIDLVELLSMLSGGTAAEEENDSTLSARLIGELFLICGLQDRDEALLERHIMSHLANALRVDYDPAMETAEIAFRLQNHISDSIVEDLRPFIQVAVCISWADGKIAPEEIAVMDAALSRLKLVSRRRSELLELCCKPISPDHLADVLKQISFDNQKAWSVLALGWAVALADLQTHPSEVETFSRLAQLLGISRDRSEALQEIVTRRFRDSMDDHFVQPGTYERRALAKATMAAITAAELDSYLQAATGLKSLSLMLSSSGPVCTLGNSVDALDAMLDGNSWVSAPAVLASALFLRRLHGDVVSQQLLVVVLTCLERSR